MNIYAHFEVEIRGIIAALAETGDLPQGLDTSRITCESPRDASHGDLASNAAMVLAKPAGMPPRQLAEKILEKLETVDGITGVEIAGPGFINIKLSPDLWQKRINDILNAGMDWGRSTKGQGYHVNVEYVSANPTGPLHAAHAWGNHWRCHGSIA